jgi:site-specific recombinase XerD
MDPVVGIPLDQFGKAIAVACRQRGLSLKTTGLYIGWTRRFVIFQGRTHPDSLNAGHIRCFLIHLAKRNLSTSSLRQALLALRFVYHHVLHQPLSTASCTSMRARRATQFIGSTLPTRAQVAQTIRSLHGTPRLVAQMQFGCGLRLREIIALRLNDLDRACRNLTSGGRKLQLPAAMIPALIVHINKRRLDGATMEDPLFIHDRHPLGEQMIQRAYRSTGHGLTPRSMRVAYAMHQIEQGVNLRQVQELMGLRDVRTTERYRGLTTRGPGGTISPLDDPAASGLGGSGGEASAHTTV